MRGSIVVMRLAAVNQLTVLGALRVLDEKHMAAARALKQESKETRKGTSPPDHSVFRRLWVRTRHRQGQSMTESAPSSTVLPCALEPLTPRGYTFLRSCTLGSNGLRGPAA